MTRIVKARSFAGTKLVASLCVWLEENRNAFTCASLSWPGNFSERPETELDFERIRQKIGVQIVGYGCLHNDNKLII